MNKSNPSHPVLGIRLALSASAQLLGRPLSVLALLTGLGGVGACSNAAQSTEEPPLNGTATSLPVGSGTSALPPNTAGGAGSMSAGAVNTAPGASGSPSVNGTPSSTPSNGSTATPAGTDPQTPPSSSGTMPDTSASAVTLPTGDPAPSTAAPTETYTAPATPPADETGADLWLRYKVVPLSGLLAEYQAAFTQVVKAADSPSLNAAAEELVAGLSGLTGVAVAENAEPTQAGAVVVGTPETSTLIASLPLATRVTALGLDGYIVEGADVDGKHVTVVAGKTEVGALYGSFALLRHLQSHQSTAGLSLTGAAKVQNRLLNHWDNLDGSVERGYAGNSLWQWSSLPGTISPRYKAYARANASLGINGTVLTNVNANADVLKPDYLAKVKALADVFRPYGIKVYLTARFSAPIDIGGKSTADPADAGVKQWWEDKADEIYGLIPDFGGFLVKANSEGQPGPQTYNRTHVDGANMLADAVAPHGGIVMWRAFVYSSGGDRIAQAYNEFQPYDGDFRDNVLVQAKNGALDFQPREPFHPLFGAMPQTGLSLELQITKEYLGEDTHLAYLGTLFEEVLKSDTYSQGAGSTVARIVDGSLQGNMLTAIAGVSNVGSDANWTGSHFNQANWYAFGRLAWDPDLSAAAVAEEWIRQTLSNDPAVVTPVKELMLASREAIVNYMTPLGLVHIMGTDHHYGPMPWEGSLDTPEWNPTYYHDADATGIGFDRTASGSKAVEQYFPEVEQQFSSKATVPDKFLLFFHHVGWQEMLPSGKSLWEEMVYRYSLGVDQVGQMRDAWHTVEGRIDSKRYTEVDDFLEIQHYEARWWRDACLQYFRSFANLTIPAAYAAPANDLNFYKGLTCPSDVKKPRCNNVYNGSPSPAILP